MDLYQTAIAANEGMGVRVEYVKGLTVWEAFPSIRHQSAIDRIRGSVRPRINRSERPCGCVHYADIYVRFPDGSLKRPDISFFCQEPEETTTAVMLLPEAVIEVISPDYEAKDL